jgi:5-carboxymethyl-2-hydroxymuconate isomerase
VHEAVLETGLAALDALRTRGEPRAGYRIADLHPDNAFLAITARLAPGRSDDDKQRLLNAMLGAAEQALGTAAANTMLSVEYQEINPGMRINKNNLRDVIATRQ